MSLQVDPIEVSEPAHLGDAAGFSPSLRRYAPPPDLGDVVRRFWVPVWSLPPGEVSVQRVLQYPVCQVVVGHDDALLAGPERGLGRRALSGVGWAVGAMLQPAAGAVLTGRSVRELIDGLHDLVETTVLDPGLVEAVRAVMSPAPAAMAGQQEACRLLGEALAVLLPIDEEGRLVNEIVAYVEGDGRVLRVAQICDRFDVGERSLQRLMARRVGLTPKWLIQRRRLQEAAGRLRAKEQVDLARLALELGYSDQAHFTRDFRSVTGVTPGALAAGAVGQLTG